MMLPRGWQWTGVLAAAALVTGCAPKHENAQASQVLAPAMPAPPAAAAPAPQKSDAPATPAKPAEAPAEAAKTDEPAPVVHHHHKPKPVAPATQPTQQAAAAPVPAQPAAVSAIGQLSTGGSNSRRDQIATSLNMTEQKLNAIPATSLNDQQQRTAAQIRAFVKQAREALASGDEDGAGTLAEKARVLLGELNK